MAQTDQTSSQVAAAGTTSEEAQQILDRLASRFSCRDFDHSPMDPDLLAAIVADGVQAPSSCNQQQWHFIVVDDPARMPLLSGENATIRTVRFRTLGCWPVTAAIQSQARDVASVVG